MNGPCRSSQCRGGVLVEGMLAVTLLVPTVLLAVEWARRGAVEVALAAGACTVARDVRWGLSPTASFRRAEPLFRAAGGDAAVPRVRRQSQPLVQAQRGNGVEARLHDRAPLLWRFPLGKVERHHFEVTHRCLSP